MKQVSLSDYALLAHPLLNKGMAFSEQERDEFLLHGLLPPYVATIEDQRLRSYLAFQSKTSPLEKHIYLRDLQDSNETLFYNLLLHHLEEMLPIIYTPVVGEGSVHFGRIYRRPRGLFLSYPHRDKIDQILSHQRFDSTEVIVVSDGERVLGLGDQGVGGMGISIGKLSLYTMCAGIYPGNTLPVLLDTGTDNPERLQEPYYVGWRHPRIRGEEYDAFIERFVSSVQKRFPHVLLQWEDFAQDNANRLLSRYRDALCTFNDDIQGTAAVAIGTILAAVRAIQSRLVDQKIVIAGAGSAGCGIAELISSAMQDEGLSESQALERLFLVDKEGLLVEGMKLHPFQKKFAKHQSNNLSLFELVRRIHPTVLIGVSGQGGLFSEQLITEMARHVGRPLIFPLSNPTSRSEATPQDLLQWTQGRALVGTGSPFEPLLVNSVRKRVDQTNNAYIFPGIGLGVIASRARRVTDQMFMAAAKVLASSSPAKHNPEANLLPPLSEIRELSFQIGLAVAEEAIQSGLAEKCPLDELILKIRSKIWEPDYVPYKRVF